jgi:hypothetical protein
MPGLSPRDLRRSLVNCSRGEAERLAIPDDLDTGAWPDVDLLAWIDPKAPQQAAVVVPRDGGAVGVKLRLNSSSGGRARMCSWCCTVHPGSGVTLVVAARAGKAGRDGNSVGVDVCADLRCSEYARGTTPPPAVSTAAAETMSVDDRVARLRDNLDVFLRRVQR